MKKIFGLALVAILAMLLANCTSTPGPSCTFEVLGTAQTCSDYSKATAALIKTEEAACVGNLAGNGFKWATTGCTLSKCGAADASGVVACTQ